MKLVRDLLDKSVVDRHGHELGRVDSIVLEMRPGAPPRVAAIELGAAVLAHRLWPPLSRWMKGLEVALGVADELPLRVPFSAIVGTDPHVKVDKS